MWGYVFYLYYSRATWPLVRSRRNVNATDLFFHGQCNERVCESERHRCWGGCKDNQPHSARHDFMRAIKTRPDNTLHSRSPFLMGAPDCQTTALVMTMQFIVLCKHQHKNMNHQVSRLMAAWCRGWSWCRICRNHAVPNSNEGPRGCSCNRYACHCVWRRISLCANRRWLKAYIQRHIPHRPSSCRNVSTQHEQ